MRPNNCGLQGILILIFSLVSFSGCKVHQSLNICRPNICVFDTYQYAEEEGQAVFSEWWKEFKSEELNSVMAEALMNNLTLKESWWRVVQACAQVRIQGAAKFPELISTPAVFHIRNPGGGITGFGTDIGGIGVLGTGGAGGGTTAAAPLDSITIYSIDNVLTYEVDLWRRVDSLTQSACYEMKATREELEATALTLTGTVAEVWFTIQEQKNLIRVIDHQIEVSKTLLELIELRFSVGESSALDVYQQRLQLAQTEAEKPPALSLLETSLNRLYTLLGEAPRKCDPYTEEDFVALPPFPYLGKPIDLLCSRPDLRAAQRRLKAADYDVAAAVADRFPRLDLSISYDFEATKIKDLFDDQVSRIIGRLITPIFDGGRRRAEVQRRKAIVCELLQSYGQTYLDALLEIENALAQEKRQTELVQQLEKAAEIATTNLEESKWHYINGLNDYLTVIAAIQSQQGLERRLVSEKKNLLVIRSNLYRALGG